MVDLTTLILCEEENLVRTLDEGFLLGPEARNAADLFEDFGVFEPEDDDFVLQDREFEYAVQPGRKKAGGVAKFVSKRRRNHPIHELRLDDFHLLQRDLRYAVHGANGLKLGLVALSHQELLRKGHVLLADLFKRGRVVRLQIAQHQS